MVKRLQVLLDEAEYSEIQETAQRQRMSIDEWVRQALRQARLSRPGTVEAKLSALAEAMRHEFPTGNIDEMLRDIAAGRRSP